MDTSKILNFLRVQVAAPDLTLLERLMAAYVRRVPWESASRIVRRGITPNTVECPRWPEIFWNEAMQLGTGGTCFESNYAFFKLLQSLGYDGYLTINDMGDTIGCHTAIIVLLDGEKWLVDVGMPLFALLRIKAGMVTQGSSPFLQYTVRPVGENRYHIERAPHPKPICFTLVDVPVDEPDYRTATTHDYGECGLFLNVVIINKIIDEQIWRFSSGELPYHLQSFPDGVRVDTPIPDDTAAKVASHFEIDTAIVRSAFEQLG